MDGFVALVAGLLAIDTCERDGGVFEQYFDEVKRECPVRKYNAGGMLALT